MDNFTKTIRLGSAKTYGGHAMSVYCRIKFIDGNLSISGVEGPLASGNALGSCGQIHMSLKPDDIKSLAPGWTRGKITRFLKVWKEHHLNDMRAGNPEQNAELKNHEFPGYPVSHYDWATKILDNAGLNSEYKYGSAWLREDVPALAIEFLQSLPDTDQTPAWV